MTSRERMLAALRFEEPDRIPHFEIMFELEREAFGLNFPNRNEWSNAAGDKKRRMIDQCMEIYARILETYHWDALAVYWPWSDPDGVAAAQKLFGGKVLIGSIIGGGTWSLEILPTDADWMTFSTNLIENPKKLHDEAKKMVRRVCAQADALIDAGAEFLHLANDVAFNAGTFISPDQMREFVLPYLGEEVQYIRDRGAFPFIHTDGNIMSILDDYISLGAACYQSVDPMAGMDIAEVKRRTNGKMALMGNVQCNLLQDGPLEAIRESALYCLEHASPGGGYIFGTSNTIFPGMPLEHYEYMLQVYREFLDARNQVSTQ